MTPVLVHEAELYFERGGPIQRFWQRFALRIGVGHSIHVRILGFLVITWFPLVVFALLEGRALGASPQDSLLLDFSTYARFFLGIPLLIVAELVVGPRLRLAGLQFVQGDFIRLEDYPAFDQAIARAAKRRESAVAEMIILAMALLGAWFFTTEVMAGESIATWRSPRFPGTAIGVSFTALWYHIVAVPILQFFWYRWLWRLLVWSLFLWTVSRLNLNLVATHADQAGGLGFLGAAHASLGVFAFALSCVLSAEVAFLMVFQGASIEAYKIPFITFLAVVELLFLGPLLMFVPILTKTRLAGLHEYSLLVTKYNRAFHQKWIVGPPPREEALLGSSDIQSLADLGGSFEFIRGMKVVPFSLRVALQLAIVTSLPCLPLLLLVMPISTILDLLARAVF